jgi:hypothetical protein
MRHARIGLGLALALVTGGPAADPRVGYLLPHRGLPLLLTVDGATADVAAPLLLVAEILRADLGLPLPARITARLYDGPARFEQGLVTHAAVPATRAAELARFAVGATIPGSVLLVAPAGAASPSVEWPRLIAHELAHLAQIELAAAETGPAQWLAEGMAEWVAYEVVDRLGLDDFESRRVMARAAAIDYVRRSGGLDLDALASAEGFVSGHRRAGTLATYRLVLHLADSLVAEHGFASLVGYFRGFRVSDDAAGNFTASFGLSVDAFEQAAVARLAIGGTPGARTMQLSSGAHISPS